MITLVYDNALVENWTANKINKDLIRADYGPCKSFGVIMDGKIAAGMVYFDFQPGFGDVSLSAAVDTPKAITKRVLRELFTFPFITLGMRRITAFIACDNLHSVNVAKRAGFRAEGIKRNAGYNGQNVIMFGMLKEECKWL